MKRKKLGGMYRNEKYNKHPILHPILERFYTKMNSWPSLQPHTFQVAFPLFILFQTPQKNPYNSCLAVPEMCFNSSLCKI